MEKVSSLKQTLRVFCVWDSRLEKFPFWYVTCVCVAATDAIWGNSCVVSGDVSNPKLAIAFPPLEVTTFAPESEEGNACPPLVRSTSAALVLGKWYWMAGLSRQLCIVIYTAAVSNQADQSPQLRLLWVRWCWSFACSQHPFPPLPTLGRD